MNAADLASMRATAAASLTGSASVSRLNTGKSATGGNLGGRTAAGSIACRLTPLTMQGNERAAAAQTVSVLRAYVTAAWDADVRTTDRLTVGADTWEVKTVERRDEPIVTRMLCEKVGE